MVCFVFQNYIKYIYKLFHLQQLKIYLANFAYNAIIIIINNIKKLLKALRYLFDIIYYIYIY